MITNVVHHSIDFQDKGRWLFDVLTQANDIFKSQAVKRGKKIHTVFGQEYNVDVSNKHTTFDYYGMKCYCPTNIYQIWITREIMASSTVMWPIPSGDLTTIKFYIQGYKVIDDFPENDEAFEHMDELMNNARANSDKPVDTFNAFREAMNATLDPTVNRMKNDDKVIRETQHDPTANYGVFTSNSQLSKIDLDKPITIGGKLTVGIFDADGNKLLTDPKFPSYKMIFVDQSDFSTMKPLIKKKNRLLIIDESERDTFKDIKKEHIKDFVEQVFFPKEPKEVPGGFSKEYPLTPKEALKYRPTSDEIDNFNGVHSESEPEEESTESFIESLFRNYWK